MAILLVEQKLTIALKISKRLYVMGHGRIVFEGRPRRLPPTWPCARNGLRFERLASQAIKAPTARTRSNAFVAGVVEIGHNGCASTKETIQMLPSQRA